MKDLILEINALLKRSVELRLRSDVPYGVCLSGGLDSSLLTAYASEVSNRPVNTFSLKIGRSSLDESIYAKTISDYFSTKHTFLDTGEYSNNLLDGIENLIDEPIADSSLIPTFWITREIKKHVKVALGGDGGDELFGGYSLYKEILNRKRNFNLFTNALIGKIAYFAKFLPLGMKGRNFLMSMKGGASEAIIWNNTFFDPFSRKKILSKDVLKYLGNNLCSPENANFKFLKSGYDMVDGMLRLHFHDKLQNDFLVKLIG